MYFSFQKISQDENLANKIKQNLEYKKFIKRQFKTASLHVIKNMEIDMKRFIVLASVLLTACSTTKLLNTKTYEQTLMLAEQQWKANKENSQYKEYFNTWNNFNNENKLDEKDGCYKYGKESIKLILVQNSVGLVENVVTQSDDKKTQCFVKSYTGVKFPKPPIAPFYHRMTMN